MRRATTPTCRRFYSAGFADIYRIAASAFGATPDELKSFLATGMLLNVAAAMNLRALDEPWAKEMLAACLLDPE